MATTTIVTLTDSTNGWMNADFLPKRLYARYGRSIRWAYNGSYTTPSYGTQSIVYFGGSGADIIDMWSNGVGGAKSGDVDTSDIATLVTAKSPDIVLVALGINDGGAGTGVQANLEALYDNLVAAVPTATIILCSQNPVVSASGTPDVRDAVQAAATAKGAMFVDVYQAFIDTGDYAAYLGDGIHPNDDGKDLYAATIEPALVATGLLGAEQEASTVAVIDPAELVLRANRYSGSGNWLDESGNGHHATPVGSPTWNGEKFALNGVDQYFTVPHSAGIDFAAEDEFTVVVVAGVDAGSGSLFNKGRVNAAQHYYLVDVSPEGALDRTRSSIADGTTQVVSALTDGPAVGERATVALRRTSTDLLVTLDGVTQSTTDTTTATLENTEDALIGARRADFVGTPEGLLTGDIYGVAVFGTALSDAEVAQVGVELIASPSQNRMGGTGAIRKPPR